MVTFECLVLDRMREVQESRPETQVSSDRYEHTSLREPSARKRCTDAHAVHFVTEQTQTRFWWKSFSLSLLLVITLADESNYSTIC